MNDMNDKEIDNGLTEEEYKELVRRIDLQNYGNITSKENLENNKKINELVDKEQEGIIKMNEKENG